MRQLGQRTISGWLGQLRLLQILQVLSAHQSCNINDLIREVEDEKTHNA